MDTINILQPHTELFPLKRTWNLDGQSLNNRTTGNEIFYFDTADTTDLGRTKMTAEIEERLLADVESDRGITSLATPTTIYIENGEFKDAIQGAYGMDGGTNYLIFCEVIEGKYVGKATYTDKLETE